ncbi:uncharacterized protein [Nicotiana tomentosiformis]|uniref:uncharacterized protein n=1 Tax=Nicotiana tomentosiformis TaxID=4098 RepID=UPI00388C4F98
MEETSSAWQSRETVPQGDPNMIHLNKEFQDHGQDIAELTTTMNQLIKAQQQTQASWKVHAMEGVHVLVSKKKMKGNQRQSQKDMYSQDDGCHTQDDSFQEQNKEVQFVNNYQNQQDTIPNPKKDEAIKRVFAVSTRRGKLLKKRSIVVEDDDDDEEELPLKYAFPKVKSPKVPKVALPKVDDPPKVDEVPKQDVPLVINKTPKVIEVPKCEVPKKTSPRVYKQLSRPPPPFAQRFAKQQQEVQLQKFYDMLNQISFNVPFMEALEKMSGCAKFIKDLVTKKKNVNFETIKLRKSFVSFEGKYQLHALCRFKKLGLGDPRSTSMKLLMADRTLNKPLGVIDDVLVKVDHFYFVADFVILDCEVDMKISIILGRPFLATGRAICDVEVGEIKFRLNDEEVIFLIQNSMKQPHYNGVISVVDVVDDDMEDIFMEKALQAVLLNSNNEAMDGYKEAMMTWKT